MCSLVGLPITRSQEDVFFVGSAMADTMLAGAGHHKWGTGVGHSGIGRSRKIYGQLVQIDRLRGVSANRLPMETKSVVLVPWDYGPDCSTVIWGQTAQWVTPGTHGVYQGTLRPRDEWANGIPTLDVFAPDFSPYPSGRHIRYLSRDTIQQLLSLEDVLDLYELLPTDSVLAATPETAIQPIEEWARRNTALVTQEPARSVLRLVRVTAEEQRVSMIKSPIGGTYRFVVTVPEVESLVVYARTEDRPWSTARARYEVGTPEDDASERALVGYHLMTAWASSPRALPKRSNIHNSSPTISIGLTPVFDSPDSSVWHGGDGALDSDRNRGFWNRAVRPRYPLIYDLRKKDWYYMPGFWTIYRDGTARYRNIVELNGVVILSIVGERISSEIMTRSRDEN
jgi:hypothetical protein